MLSSDLQKISEQFPEYKRQVDKHYRWNFLFLLFDTSFFSFSLAFLSVDTILPYFVANLTDQRVWIGVVSSLYFWGFYFPQIIGAYLVSGKSTRKKTIFWIALTERIGILLIALLASSLDLISKPVALGLFLFSYAIFAITNGLIGPAYADFVSKTINKNRGQFYGFTNGLSGLIGFGASLLASHFLDLYSFPTNLRYLFWIGFFASFISPMLILQFRETPFPVERARENLGAFIRKIPAMLVEFPIFVRFLVCRSFISLGLMSNSFFALYAVNRFGLTEGMVGTFTMVILLTQSALGFVWGRVGDKVGFKRVYVLAAGLLVMQTSLAILVDAPWVYYIIVFGIGGVYAANRTSDANFVFEIAPPAETSRFIGVSNTLLSPVLAASPLIGGMLVDKFSFMTLFTVNLVISIAALMITIFWLPEPRKAGGGAVATMIPAPAYSVVEEGELHSRSAESPKN